jgi:hypothetical protein
MTADHQNIQWRRVRSEDTFTIGALVRLFGDEDAWEIELMESADSGDAQTIYHLKNKRTARKLSFLKRAFWEIPA